MIYLKFDNELQMKMELDEYRTRDTQWDEHQGEYVEVGDKFFIGKPKSDTYGHVPRQWELWVRGTLWKATDESDPDGNPVMEKLKGFHVDFYDKCGCAPIEEWTEKGYIISPEHPMFTK